MKKRRYVARESWFSVRGSRFLVRESLSVTRGLCTSVNHVYQFASTVLVHSFLNNISHLAKSARCVPCVPAFLSCLTGFFKQPFYFLNRMSI